MSNFFTVTPPMAAVDGAIWALIIVATFFLIVVASHIKIVPQARVYVIERLGRFHGEWHTGLHFLVPFIDRISNQVSIKENVIDFRPQDVITKDNVSMKIDTVLFYQVLDPKLYTYGVERPLLAIENLTSTTLRNIIGGLELDSTLTSRDTINNKITEILDDATDRWGVKVHRVELKNILPPREILDAMGKQMKAERERREKILTAEGDRKSQILVAEGEKESKILRAEAERQSEILRAEAEKQALVLRADGIREQKILEAEGEAQAIELVQRALAESIERLNVASPSSNVIALKSLEAFAKAADGQATKIIIPSEIQALAGLATGIKELTANS